MTRLETPIKDILGTKYYTYQLMATNYNPALNETITIVCAVSNDYNAEQPSSVILYQNNVEIGSGTLQTTGTYKDNYTWTITCDTPGLQVFRVKDTSVEVYVENALVDMIYPVGSIYMSVNSTSPSVLFGGTWTQLEDTFLLACGTTYSNGATGGSATVSLTESEMPRHTHIQNSHNHTQNAHHHTQYSYYSTGTGSSGAYVQSTNRKATRVNTDDATATNIANTATNKYTGGTGTSESASNGSAHENMPPYLAVYMWKRTA